MEKINYSQNLNIKNRQPFFHLSLHKTKTLNNNEKQILFNHKSSLEALLNNIKNSQLEYLSKDNNNKNTKKILIALKENLNLMLKEKNKKINYIKNQNEIIKNKLQSVLFPDSKDSEHSDNNNKKIIDNNILNSSLSEINQLKLLNFQIQNEIDKTKYLIEQKVQYHSYAKSIPFFFQSYCNNNYETNKKITKYLKDIIKEIRKEFIKIVKEKMNKEFEINGLIFNINYIKDNIDSYKLNGYKKYINSEDIIQEDSKEYTKSMITTQSKRNSISNNNNQNLMKKLNNNNINGSSNNYNNNKKQRIIKDKLPTNNIFYTHRINKKILTDNYKTSIKNYLNMNINVNINLNNNNNNNYIEGSFNSSLDSNETEEEKAKNEQYEMNLNDKNKIIITPIITSDNYNHQNSNNSISSETDSNDDDDSFVLDINNN